MEKQHRARKRFGQNFLNDSNIINNILRAIHPEASQHLVEIGPGQGAITAGLLESGAKLDVIELDRDLVPILEERFQQESNFTIHQGDALKFDFGTLNAAANSLRVVGNLPYNISTPLIFHLLDFKLQIRDMHFMLQKEVVKRLAAQPGGKDYGRLSIMAQYHCQVDNLFDVPPTAFTPQPKVDSAIVRLTPYDEAPHPASSTQTLDKVVKAAFSQRRKTLRNTLKSLIDAAAMEQLGIDPGARAETLSTEAFVAISNHISNQSPHNSGEQS